MSTSLLLMMGRIRIVDSRCKESDGSIIKPKTYAVSKCRAFHPLTTCVLSKKELIKKLAATFDSVGVW